MFLQKFDIWENLVPEIWAEMYKANQIPGFLNPSYL